MSDEFDFDEVDFAPSPAGKTPGGGQSTSAAPPKSPGFDDYDDEFEAEVRATCI